MPLVAFIQNIGPGGLLLILLIVLILFGAGRMPQVLEQLGKGMKAFRDAQKDEAIDVTDAKSKPKALSSSEADTEAMDAEEVRTEKSSSKH